MLVTAASGRTGTRVADRLRAAGLPVRAVSRSTTPRFDWEEPATWADVLDGARSAYVAFSPDLSVPGAADTLRAFAAAARSAGLDRLSLLSGRGEAASLVAEDAVLEEFPAASVVRSSWFAQNFTEGEFAAMLTGGVLALPVGDVPEPFVDADDVADVAVATLTGEGHAGEVYEVAGPRLLTFAEVVAEIGALVGRDLQYVELEMDDAVAGWREAGLPPEVVELLSALFPEVFGGQNSVLTDGVERALGRPPRDISAHLSAAAAAGVWS
ncbi:NmrA family protein [Beutenbergia cavernae DSM 12333]|uniref:NmrA family protein n=1 Tax=Beutenbergia cavernae (strain ATCC BAA-8 / DSM 12333 / CCUG 43141 / JCM 11478 / NBRC 16432 / NCIMB 13614 / HKI 0122) TaxID=471853 RepID=C5BVZ4_BEUC1|nr:NmrA family protein [Beutenbergia cavernae DSM 12333]